MIVDRVGPAIGYRVHTGRSRNDQVLIAQKLCVRARMIEVLGQLGALIEALVARAESDVDVVMPGYTHMQPARPTTVGQWCAAYADMFARDFRRLQDAYRRHDTSPLGAAESHGTTWPLDRVYVQELLGLSGLDEIPLDAISSRGESDADFLAGLSFVALHMSKLAQDLLLFNTYEYGYAVLGSGQAARMGKLTGSSIMPQKRNPDVLELLRGQASEIYSYLVHALEVLEGAADRLQPRLARHEGADPPRAGEHLRQPRAGRAGRRQRRVRRGRDAHGGRRELLHGDRPR